MRDESRLQRELRQRICVLLKVFPTRNGIWVVKLQAWRRHQCWDVLLTTREIRVLGKVSYVSWGSTYASGAGPQKEGTWEVQLILGDQGFYLRRQSEIIQGLWTESRSQLRSGQRSSVWWVRGLAHLAHSPFLSPLEFENALWKHQLMSSTPKSYRVPWVRALKAKQCIQEAKGYGWHHQSDRETSLPTGM